MTNLSLFRDPDAVALVKDHRRLTLQCSKCLAPLSSHNTPCPECGRVTFSRNVEALSRSVYPTAQRPLVMTNDETSAWHIVAQCACFFGNMPMGLVIFICLGLFGDLHFVGAQGMKRLLFVGGLFGFYATLLFWVKPVDRREVVILVLWGMGSGIGIFASVLFIFIGLMIIGWAGILGLVLGVISVGPCWWRGDSTGRTMAILGCLPVVALFFLLR